MGKGDFSQQRGHIGAGDCCRHGSGQEVDTSPPWKRQEKQWQPEQRLSHGLDGVITSLAGGQFSTFLQAGQVEEQEHVFAQSGVAKVNNDGENLTIPLTLLFPARTLTQNTSRVQNRKESVALACSAPMRFRGFYENVLLL